MRMTGPSGLHTFLAARARMTTTLSNNNSGRGFRVLVADGWHHFIGPLKVQGGGQHLLFSRVFSRVDSRRGRKLRICAYIYCVPVRRRRVSENRLPSAFASTARLVRMRRWILGPRAANGVRFVLWCRRERMVNHHPGTPRHVERAIWGSICKH